MSLIDKDVFPNVLPLFISMGKPMGGFLIMPKLKCNCENCKKELYRYSSQILTTVFCSKQCRSEYHKVHLTTELTCYFCSKVYRKRNSSITGKNHFCSRKCKDLWQKEGLSGEENPFYQKTHTDSSKGKMSVSLKIVYPKGKNHPKYKRVSVQCDVCGKTILKIPYLVERSKKQYCSIECHGLGKSDYGSGINNPNYNSNLTDFERNRNRAKELGYVKFKNDVLKRDNSKCVVCKTDYNLVVHHLNSHHWDKENRINVDNGATLCQGCHKEFHKTYGYKNNTKKQFIEYAEASE